MTNLGIMFKRSYPPEHIIAFAKQAESAGFDELWVVEDCFYAGGIAQATTALAHTQHIKVGLGITPAVSRNPAFIALEIASLARIVPQRFLPGLGHGVRAWMEQIGALPKSQLGALEAYTKAIRAILQSESVTMQGEYVNLDAVQLEYPIEHIPPIQLGVRGPKSLQLSGRVADGTILAEGCSPAYVHWAKEQIDKGRQEAGRTDHHRITVYIYWSMDTDIALAKQRIRQQLISRIMADKLDIYLKPTGYAEQVEAWIEQGGETTLRDNIPDEWLHQFAVVGTTDDCLQTIQNLAKAGVDSVVLVPMMDTEPALSTYAKQVIQAL